MRSAGGGGGAAEGGAAEGGRGGLGRTGCSSVTAMSAIGCDASMGIHLERVAASWSATTAKGRVGAQLEKSGLERLEREEIEERILSLARNYDAGASDI